MVMALMEESTVLVTYAPSEIAAFVRKSNATVKQWFTGVRGVLKYPRGDGSQSPTYEIPEAVVRAKLIEIGFTDEEINRGLIQPHARRLEAERAAKAARREPLPGAPKRGRGRPPKVAPAPAAPRRPRK
jgi:hypothetical protein